MAGTLLGISIGDTLNSMTHTPVQVKNTSTVIVPKNSDRRYLLLINDSNETMYICFGRPAVIHDGIRIEKNGGKAEFSHCSASLIDSEVHAVHGSNGLKIMLVTEGE